MQKHTPKKKKKDNNYNNILHSLEILDKESKHKVKTL